MKVFFPSKKCTWEFEYFKTIVAHEALHQIFFAFDDNEIISFLSES
jgi:hypothetical protein